MLNDNGLFVQGGIFRELAHESAPDTLTLLEEARRVADHPLYHAVRTLSQVREFMRNHVWCVWDFMSLAKSVQSEVAPHRIPWYPPPDASLVSAINEIIKGEEADEGPGGTIHSHLEIYMAAMREASVDTCGFETAMKAIAEGSGVGASMKTAGATPAAVRFVTTTLKLCKAPLHERVAAFCLSREELVPTMFTTFLRHLPKRSPHLSMFMWYLRRHVRLDTDLHGPLSARLFRATVGADPKRRSDAIAAAIKAIRARALFLDDTLQIIQKIK